MSDFADAFDLAHACARDVMGETISFPGGVTLTGIVEAPEFSLGRVTLGGKADPVTSTIIVSAVAWTTAGLAHGVIVTFRGLEARVTDAVRGHGDRLELRLQPVNLFEGI